MDAFLQDAAKHGADTPKPSYSEEELEGKLQYIQETLRQLELDCSAIASRMEQVGNLGDLEERRRETEEALGQKRLEYDALQIAVAELGQANGLLRSRFAPALEKRTSEIFEFLTGGSFRLVEIKNASLELAIRQDANAQARGILELSQGTLDELYLAVRLALCEVALAQDVPIVLDDALVNFDDVRMGRALDYLQKLSQKRQVILFSCHRREAEYCHNNPHIHVQALDADV